MVNMKRASKKDLVYYYSMENGAPSEISRKVLKYLLIYKKNLPFDNVKVFCKKKDVPKVKEELKNVDVMSYSNLNEITYDSVVHIPVLPSILPNSKFLLYIYCSHIKRTKLILQYHGDVRTELRSSYKDVVSLVHIFTYLFIPNILKSADMLLVHSYDMNRIVQNYGVNKSFVIPNAIESDWFKPLEKRVFVKKRIDKRTYNIFYHGRLSREKGVDLLIEAVAFCLKDTHSNIKLYIAGEGKFKKYLENLCYSSDINKKVVFLGNLNMEEIKYFLKNVDLAIYPSRFDAFSLAILEALSCADCNVYFSKKAGIYNFIIKDGFDLNSFEPSVENIVKIIQQNRLNSKSELQKRFAKKYTFDSVISEYINLYTSNFSESNNN